MRSLIKVIQSNIKLVVKLGSGFFADAYNLFVIDIVLSILGQLSESDPTGLGFSTSAKSWLASVTSAGAIIGMLLFGLVGDYIGRKIAVLCTGTLIAVGSIASALCQRSESFPLVTQLVICQAILGLGIGGEYPLSATLASETRSETSRSRVVAGVFSLQGFGMLFSCLLPLIFIKAGVSLELTWRLSLGLGAIPALVALFFRVKMHTDPPVAHSNHSSWALIKTMSRILVGCMLCWFLLDVAFYGTGEFKHAVRESTYAAGLDARETVLDTAIFGLITASIALPGYLLTVVFIDRVGVGRLQLIGFFNMTVLYVAMGLSVQFFAPSWVNLMIFGITFLCANFGPNATTFIIPSEVFPTQIRATCHGIAAAAGKAGAVVGGAGFPQAIAGVGLNGVMYICASISVAGAVATWIFLSPKLVDKLISAQTDAATSSPHRVALEHTPTDPTLPAHVVSPSAPGSVTVGPTPS